MAPISTNPEVRAFLEARHQNYTLDEASRVLNVTPQALSQMLRRDMSLSSAERIARAYGYTLKLDWPPKTYPHGYVPDPSTSSGPYSDGNLRGLAQYLRDSHLTVNRVALNAGVCSTTLYHAFATGDIRLSVMRKVAASLGITPGWTWVENK